MKKLLLLLVLLVSGAIQAQIYTMQNGTVSTNGGTFYDSGGAAGNYGASQNFQMTFCPSTPGTYIQLVFNNFDTEGFPFDYMRIYNGTGTSGTLLGTFGGTQTPMCSANLIASTHASGCITVTFTSDGSLQQTGWMAQVIATTTPGGDPPSGGLPNTVCSSANAFCANAGAIEFPNSSGGCATSTPTAITSNTCLGSAPNPAWYYLEIGIPGNINLEIEQTTGPNGAGTGLDVDYAIWGPFTNISQACSNFNAASGGCVTDHDCYGNVVDCSYSSDPIENATIPNALVGQVYMVLITNYDGSPGYISMTQTNSGTAGAGSTDCSIVCPTAAGVNPTTCSATDGSIRISGLDPNTSYTITYLDDTVPVSTTLTSNAAGIAIIIGLNAGNYTNIGTNFPGCTSIVSNVILSAATAPTLTSVTNNTPICSGSNAVFNLTGTANATVTYNINSGGNQTVVLSAAGTATVTVNAVTTTTILNATAIALPGCSAPLATSSIVSLTTAPTIVLTSAATTANQTVCLNAPITNIRYTIAGGGTGATVTALPTGITGSFSGGVFTISGTPTASGPFNYTVTTTGGCSSSSLSGTITVNPGATITLLSAAATTSQNICVSTPITNISYTIAGGGTGATVTGLPAGVVGNFAGGVFTISGTPTVAGPFNYTVTTTGGCSAAALSGSITVNSNATILLSSAITTDSQTVCIGAAITNITYAISNGGTGATVLGLPTGVVGSFAGGTFTISGTPTASGPFNYTITTTGGCGSSALSGTITISPAATIALLSAAATTAQTPCINSVITNISYTIGGGGTGATVSGLPAGVTGSFSGTTFTISGTPTASGPFNYTVTTTGGCSNNSLSGTITVNPNATLTLSSAAATTNQSPCINTAITNITYIIANGGSGATVTGLPTGVTGSLAGGTFTISGTPTVSGAFNYTVTTTGGCASSALSGTITISPAATITLLSAATTTSQTICVNTPIVNIQYTIANGGTGATASGLPTGVSGTFASGVFTISGTPTASGSFNYTVITTGGCLNNALSGTITVNPTATIALTSAATTTNQTVCINIPMANIDYTIGNGATGATVLGLPAGLTAALTGSIFTISGMPTATGTFNYTVTTTGGCASAALSGTIVVNSAATIALTSASTTNIQTLCINASIANIEYTIANGGTGATVTGLPTGVTGNFASGVFTISGTPTTAGTFNYTVSTTGGCGTASLSGTIVVNQNVTMTLTSAATTTNQTLCINTALTNIEYTVANGGTGTTVSGLPAGVSGNFTSGIFTISGTPTASGVFNYTVTTTGGCSSLVLNGTITVNPNAAIALSSPAATTTQSVCNNSVIANIVYAISNATGGSVSGLPTGVTGIFNAGVFTISGTPTAIGLFNYTVTTTGGCASASLSGTITVNQDVTIGLTSAAATTNQLLCIDTAIANIVYATANGATGVTILGLPTGVSGNFASGMVTISGTPTVSGMFNYTVTTIGGCASANLSGTITVEPNATITLSSGTPTQIRCINTPIVDIDYTIGNGGTGATVLGLPSGLTGIFTGSIFTISGTPTSSGIFNYTVTTSGGCASASLAGTITVNPNATIALTSNLATINQTRCINTPIIDITYALANGATGATVTGLPTGISGNFNSGIFTISGTATVSGVFNYSVATTGGCATASSSGTIAINPNVTLTLTSGAASASQIICTNTVLTPITYNIANGGTGATITGLPNGITAVYNSGIFTISGTPTQSGEFTYTITTTGGCASATAVGSIGVNPNATIALTSAAATTNQIRCINSAIANISYTIGDGATGETVSGLPTGITGSLSAGVYTISGNPSISGIFNYTVSTAGGCSFATLSGTITVNALAAATMSYAGSPYCTTLTTPQSVILTGTGPYTGGTFTSTTGLSINATSGAVNPSLSTPGNYTVTYLIPASGGCAAIPVYATLKITQVPTATISYATPFCTSVNTLQNVSLSGTAVYLGGTFSAASGLSINTTTGAINPNLSTPGNYTITYSTPIGGGCAAVPATTNVTINATPIAVATPNLQAICSEDTTNIALSSLVAGTTFTWTVVQNNVSGASNGHGNLIDQTLATTNNTVGTAVYTIVPSTAFCTGNAITVTITVNPLPRPSLVGGVICRNPRTGIVMRTYTLNAGLNNADYNFSWSHNTATIVGATDNFYVADEPGIYTVVATNVHTGCISYPVDAAVSESLIAEVALISGNDAFVDNPIITVTVQGSGNYEYQLDNGSFQASNIFPNLNLGEHTIHVRDLDDCTDIEEKFTVIGYPKFFTPNNDGFNDTWNIFALAGQSGSKISIFDRYGKLIKQISPNGPGWDGTLNGYPLPSTDYWFVVEYLDQLINKEFKAHFSLKR